MTSNASYKHKNPHLVKAFENSLEPMRSAFNDLNTVERRTDIDIQSSAGTSILRDVTSTTNSGNVPQDSQPTGELLVESGTTTGSTAYLESAAYGQYVAGYIAQQGIGIRVPVQPSGDAEARWGYFNTNDGFLWGYDANGLYIARLRNGTIEEKTYRENWNGLDPNQVRESDFDPSEGAIYQIDFAWYGYGAIEFRIVSEDTDSAQDVVTVHRMAVSEQSSITNPNQPIRADVDNGSTTDNVQLYVGGRQFSILGEPTDNSRLTSENNRSISAADGSLTHVVSMRRKASDDRRVNISVSGIDFISDANSRVAIVWDPNLSGTTYGTPSGTASSETIVESSTAGTYDGLGDGRIIWDAFATGSNRSPGAEGIGDLSIPIPRSQPVSLVAEGLGSTATVAGILRVKEEW